MISYDACGYWGGVGAGNLIMCLNFLDSATQIVCGYNGGVGGDCDRGANKQVLFQSRTMEGMAAMEGNSAHRYGNGNDCMGSERNENCVPSDTNLPDQSIEMTR